jgi:hypothetical protein
MHERSGWKTDTTGGAEKHQHARCEATREQTRSARTGDERGESVGIQWHLAAGIMPHAARCARAVRIADLKPQYNILHYIARGQSANIL